jgi:TonB-linked SusC/RagA family outer membrane protein
MKNALLSICFLLTTLIAYGQDVRVTGTVTDIEGETLPGVTIIVKGTAIGTVTDLDGTYMLQVPDPSSVLVFSFIGMQPKEIELSGRSVLNVILERGATELDEVVVIGYGTQRRESMVAAISTISASEVVQSPTANITAGLAGKMPGLTIMLKDGELGRENIQTFIRGMATTNESAPLILVDGVEREISTLNMHDIESVSILKDASATAVFGVRGANGVILITTKRGEIMAPQISFNSSYALQTLTRMPEPLNAVEYMTVRNKVIGQHNRTTGQSTPLPYPDEIFEYYRTGYLPEYYVDRNFFDEFIHDYVPMTNTNMNIRGGNERTKYFGSLGYMRQGGPFKTERWDEYNYDNEQRLDRFTFRANVNTKINNNLDVWLNLSGYLQDKNDPVIYGDVDASLREGSQYQMIIAALADNNAMAYPDLSPEGHVVNFPGSSRTPYGNLNRTGFRIMTHNTINSTLGGEYKLDFITSGLSAKAIVSYDSRATHIRGYGRTYQNYNQVLVKDTHGNDSIMYLPGQGTDSELRKRLTQSFTSNYDLEASLNYNRSFDKHNVTGLFLYKQSQRIVNIDVPYNYLGIVGRATYAYDRKYLGEVNFGYNGSEQFAPGRRFGFFPSLSVGWVMSEENFLRTSNTINFLKLRGSYGQVGNDNISNLRFIYLDDWTQGTGDYFNGTGGMPGFPNPVYEASVSNPFVSWEVATKSNIGLETRFFRVLSLDIDVFHEERNSILITRSKTPPFVTGQLNQPPTNSGVMVNRGMEAVLGYRKMMKNGLSVNTRLSGSFARNKMISMNETPLDETFAYQYRIEGFRRGTAWGYDCLGYFDSQEEIKYWADQSGLGANVFPGDLKYRDVNGDGVIDERDMIPMKHPNVPELNFTLSSAFSYKGIDFSFLLQSVHNYNFNITSGTGRTIRDYTTTAPDGVYYSIHKYAWSEERVASGDPIHFPRMHPQGSSNGSDGSIPSNYWNINMNYLRVRNVELGYSLPERLTASLRIQSVRMFVNGMNLFVFDNMPFKYVDPELNSSLSHPIYATYNVGVNIIF